ncbi:MAG: tetratricopeptide repeat protein, partial [Planctomyces sp.]
DLEFARGNFREASADYSLLLKKQPHNTELLLKRARLLLKVGRCDAAETDLLQLLRLQPLSAEAWHLRGLARSRLGQRDEARRDLERSLRLDAANTACLFDLAELEAADGRSATALTLYDAALQLKPDNAVGWYN